MGIEPRAWTTDYFYIKLKFLKIVKGLYRNLCREIQIEDKINDDSSSRKKNGRVNNSVISMSSLPYT
jgi:hypothetical protein